MKQNSYLSCSNESPNQCVCVCVCCTMCSKFFEADDVQAIFSEDKHSLLMSSCKKQCTDRQIDRQTNRQTDGQTDRQIKKAILCVI